MILSCPGKLIIAGEYACVDGGPALVTTLAPMFLLKVTPASTPNNVRNPFHADSPAGRFYERTRPALANCELEWIDPYETAIGVGSSSAQFLLAVAAVTKLQGHELPTGQELLDLYWDVTHTPNATRPSGVDLVAQWSGGPVVVRNQPLRTQMLPAWTNSKATMLLAFTGVKAKTHEHLARLAELGFPAKFRGVLNELNQITTTTIESWQEGDAIRLGSALNSYQTTLAHGGLAPIDFTQRLREVQSWPGVLGAKGAGAQGGDCVLILAEDVHLNSVMHRIRTVGWEPLLPEFISQGVGVVSL